MDAILEKGSSLHPAFQRAVDAAFATLVLILLALLFATRSLHFVFLTLVALALWASVKWFVHELRQANAQEDATKQEKSQ